MCCKYGKLNCIKWTCNSLVLSIIFTWVTSLDYYYGLLRFTNCPHCTDTHCCIPYLGTPRYVLAAIIACSQSLKLCLLDAAQKRVAANVVRSSRFFPPSACNLYRYLFNHSTPWNINCFALGSTPAYFFLTLFRSRRCFFRVTEFICVALTESVSKYNGSWNNFGRNKSRSGDIYDALCAQNTQHK